MNREEKLLSLFLLFGTIGILYSLIMMNNDPTRYLFSEILIGVGMLIACFGYKKTNQSEKSATELVNDRRTD